MIKSPIRKLMFEYLSIDTCGKKYKKSTRLLGDYLKKSGFKIEYLKIPVSIAGEGRVNLVAKYKVDPKLPTLLIYNHVDVVPGEYPGAFEPKIKNGKIYARGAADHKGGTIAVIAALDKIDLTKLKYNLVFIATTDEETGQSDQLEYLIKKLKLSKNTICFDTDTYAGGVTVARLGRANITITLYGKSTHSATSYLGINAIEQTVELVGFLLKEKLKYENRRSATPTFSEKGKKRFPTDLLNINTIRSGGTHNVVPDTAVIKINCRYIPETDTYKESAKLVTDIESFCKSKKIKYSINLYDAIESGITRHPAVFALDNIYAKYSGERGLYCVSASNPLTDITMKKGWSQVGIGLFRHDNNVHGINEFAYVKDFENLRDTVSEFLVGELM